MIEYLLRVSIRWADKNYEINEDLVDLAEVEITDALTLTSTLNAVTCRYLVVPGQYFEVHPT